MAHKEFYNFFEKNDNRLSLESSNLNRLQWGSEIFSPEEVLNTLNMTVLRIKS